MLPTMGIHDHADKQLGDADLLDQRLYGPDKGLRDESDGGGRPQEHDVRDHLAERRLLLIAGPGRFLSPAEVEEQVQGIEDDQHHCHADAQVLQRRITLGRVEQTEDGWKRQSKGDASEHRRVRSRDGGREVLGAVLDPADQEASSQHQEHVTDNRAYDRGLHHGREPRGEGEDGNDQLGGVTEGGVEDAPDLGAA